MITRQQGRTKRGWSTAGAAVSAMLSVTLTRYPVSTLTPAPAVPALNRSPNLGSVPCKQ
jgi:hypothetical protein